MLYTFKFLKIVLEILFSLELAFQRVLIRELVPIGMRHPMGRCNGCQALHSGIWCDGWVWYSLKEDVDDHRDYFHS
jgi:hypothetical protein